MKTGTSLAEYAIAQLGRPYWWGCFGQMADGALYAQKKKQYPGYYTAGDFASQYGQKVHDCVGLIKGYRWSDTPESAPKYVGGAGRDWAELGVIDFSVVSGTVNLDGLDNYTELLFLWENVKNASTTASGYMLKINGSALTAFDAIPIKPEGSSDNYGYTYLRYNGKFWDIRRSNGANLKSNFTLANTNALCPYNVALNVGAAASIKLDFAGYQYVATSGTVTIWGR